MHTLDLSERQSFSASCCDATSQGDAVSKATTALLTGSYNMTSVYN
jgi:hypothetical protein